MVVHHTTNPRGVRVSCSSRSYGKHRTTDWSKVTCKRCLMHREAYERSANRLQTILNRVFTPEGR